MFRFTIRDVLWLTLVVGLSLGWWIEHRRADKSENISFGACLLVTDLMRDLDNADPSWRNRKQFDTYAVESRAKEVMASRFPK